jgi:hypothetical protein
MLPKHWHNAAYFNILQLGTILSESQHNLEKSQNLTTFYSLQILSQYAVDLMIVSLFNKTLGGPQTAGKNPWRILG